MSLWLERFTVTIRGAIFKAYQTKDKIDIHSFSCLALSIKPYFNMQEATSLSPGRGNNAIRNI